MFRGFCPDRGASGSAAEVELFALPVSHGDQQTHRLREVEKTWAISHGWVAMMCQIAVQSRLADRPNEVSWWGVTYCVSNCYNPKNRIFFQDQFSPHLPSLRKFKVTP